MLELTLRVIDVPMCPSMNHSYRLKETILQSLWQAMEGFFGYHSSEPGPIWTKLEI